MRALFVNGALAVANLNVVVVPTGNLAILSLGQPVGSGVVVGGSSDQTSSDKVNSVMVAQVHGGPPDPAGVDDEVCSEPREAVDHEESLEDGVGTVQRGERAEWEWRVGEVGRVHIDAEDLVDGGETSGRAVHAVYCGNKAVLALVPRRRAGEEKLNRNTSNAHPSKGASEDGSRAWRGENEHDERADERSGEVDNSVRQPSKNIENRVLVGRQNVGKVGSVQNVLQRREDANPNMRTVIVRDKSADQGLAQG